MRLGRLQLQIYYGWVITFVGLLVVTIVYGCKFCFGTLFGALLDEFGWSRTMVTSVFSVSILAQAFLQPLGGALLDKYGPRKMLTAGAALLCVSLAMFGNAHSLWSVYFSYGIMFSLATVAAGFVINTTMVSHWFERKRGIAVGIVAAGTSLGLFIFNPLLAYLIGLYGWRNAMVILGIAAGIVIAVTVLVLAKDRPEDIGQHIDGIAVEVTPPPPATSRTTESASSIVLRNWTFREAISTREFWLLFVAYIGYLFCWYSVTNHAVMAMCDMGLERVKAAGIFGCIGLVGAISGLISAWIADRLRDRKYMVAAAYLTLGLGALLFSRTTTSIGMLYVIMVLMGFGHGAAVLLSAVVADRFGVKAMGAIWGTITMAGLLGGAVGPMVVGYTYDVLKSYTVAWLMLTVLLLLSAAFVLCVRQVPQRFGTGSKE